MFGFFEAIFAFLTRQLGTRNDAANANGSLHAKVRSIQNSSNDMSNHIDNSLGNRTDTADINGSLHSKVRNLDPASKTPVIRISRSSSATRTGISVNGSGYCTGVYIDSGGLVEITLDGQLLTNDNISGNGVTIPMNMRFESSFEVDYSSGSSGSVFLIGSFLLD